MKRIFWPFGIALFVCALTAGHAARGDDGRIMVTEENDKFGSNDDRHYTQGLRVTRLSGGISEDDDWNAPFAWLASNTPIFDGGDRQRKYDWSLIGQSMFTPLNIHTPNPPTTDRPYGAWLYTGASLLQQTKQDSHDTLENAELLIGVVGPLALGGVVQSDFHQFIGVAPAQGWQNQMHNEPGLVASYERKWRFTQSLDDYFSFDAIPEAGASLGNIFTYGEISGQLRFGHNLAADYGSSHIRPSLSGTGWFDKNALQGDLGWYVFLGAQGRAVGRNIFLDGNTWRDSASVDKLPLVADFLVGASVFWSQSARLDFTLIQRTPEFVDQRGHPDRYGSVNLAASW